PGSRGGGAGAPPPQPGVVGAGTLHRAEVVPAAVVRPGKAGAAGGSPGGHSGGAVAVSRRPRTSLRGGAVPGHRGGPAVGRGAVDPSPANTSGGLLRHGGRGGARLQGSAPPRGRAEPPGTDRGSRGGMARSRGGAAGFPARMDRHRRDLSDPTPLAGVGRRGRAVSQGSRG